MKIKYLKPAPNATTGDVKDINTAQAKILIQLGFAEVYDENNSDNGNADDLFGQLDDNQNPENEPPTTNQEPSETETAKPTADDQEPPKADEVSEQVQEVAETTLAEPATPTETAKPKKTKKTNTENN
ncbi:hypothetical protein [Moraxella equi]|uniref:Uncharacterized protein n=1 Tax=Moraxella equi TaxID=60442 RepID=A0A378QQD7_9GAMM|nr:hypothetical protein [Moraxella equi]OPH38216.1 hypothetical protein B5J93_06625 [Moraxella equi]STZ03119.1 Uncharacterised protein [Moraxella equi]